MRGTSPIRLRARLIVPTIVVLLAGCCPEAYYEATAEHPSICLPRDEAPHCYGAEWWYYTGRLQTDDGHGYGIEAVVFHVPGPGLAGVADGWAAHFAVVDEVSGEFVYEQTRELGHVSIGGPAASGFHLDTLLVQMIGSEGHDELHAAMNDGSYAIDLILDDERGPVLHGDNGYVPFGQDGMSFYYSRPQMRASGTLRIDGQPHDVTGVLWFDRQWGSSLNHPWAQWNWFSLRLDDGSNVMLFVFRDEAEPVLFGTYLPGIGDPVSLASEDLVITPTAWWTSPHTGAAYPVAWEIEIIPQELTLAVAAVAEDQELDVRPSTFNIYWEGLCTITGTRAGEPLTGHAYVELTNYPR